MVNFKVEEEREVDPRSENTDSALLSKVVVQGSETLVTGIINLGIREGVGDGIIWKVEKITSFFIEKV